MHMCMVRRQAWIRKSEKSKSLRSWETRCWLTVNFNTVLHLQDGRKCGKNENGEFDFKETEGCPWKLADDNHRDVGRNLRK